MTGILSNIMMARFRRYSNDYRYVQSYFYLIYGAQVITVNYAFTLDVFIPIQRATSEYYEII